MKTRSMIALLILTFALAACGGTRTTAPGNTGSRPSNTGPSFYREMGVSALVERS